METKICTKCGIEKDLTDENFSKRAKGSKDGFRNECKECKNKYNKRYLEKNKRNILEQRRHYRYENKEIIAKKKKQYCQENKNKIAEKRKVYYQENKEIYAMQYQESKEKILEQKKQYYQRNKEAIVKRKKQWYEKNKESSGKRNKIWRENNKEHIAEFSVKWRKENNEALSKYNKGWRKDNLEKSSMYAHKYQALKRELPSTFTLEQWEKCKNHFANKCAYCGKELPLTQEHFIPVTKNGEYTANNILPACISCNSSKNNKDFAIWYPKYKFYLKIREQKILKYLGYENNSQQLKLL